MNYELWAFLLFLQNFTSAINSRAKNQTSLTYTAITALLTNGSWMASAVLMVDNTTKVLRSGDRAAMIEMILFYSVCTMTGTLVSQWVAMKWIEPKMEKKRAMRAMKILAQGQKGRFK